ncbi:MFS transporter [Pseudomonas proteolytica]|uniref:MFS transporter n=1 Tax=Pseudomonas proteolytica TaxID=219574 RepID=UPI00320821AD
MPFSKRYALLLAASLGTFLASLDISIVNVALPSIQQALATDMAGLQWVVSAYAICLSAFMLSAGPLGDRFGQRRTWLSSIALFSAGSLICALSNDLSFLLLGRAVQGIAGAVLIPGALPLIVHAFSDPKERAHAIGCWSACSALALVLGPLLGGLLIHGFGWPSIFLINLPIGALALLLGGWGISERAHPEQAALDPWGQLLSATGLGSLSYGLILAGERGFSALPVQIACACATALLAGFIWVERRNPRPLLPLGLFKNRQFAAANMASFVLGFSCYSSLFFFSLYLQQVQGLSASQTGLRMMPTFVCMAVVSLTCGRLQRMMGPSPMLISSYLLIAIAMGAMALFTPDTPYPVILVLFSLLGIGMGAAIPATGLAVMASVATPQAGTASATMNALRQTGMSLGIALLGSMMSLRAEQYLRGSLIAREIPDAAQVAQRAIQQHWLPAHAEWAAAYVNALASGFNLAMICAGACSLLVALVLGMRRKP